MKLNNAQDAIKQAIRGGYFRGWNDKESDNIHVENDGRVFTDPLFWQALGKARGLTTNTSFCGACGNDRDWKGNGTIPQWKSWAESWFETRLSNGDESAFWQSLP